MDEAGFWDVIERAYAALECGYYDDEPAEAVAQAWRDEVPAADVADFADHFARAMERARRPGVLAAARLLAGATDDERDTLLRYGDGYAAFRASLIALGRSSFEAVLADPDVLASLPDADAVDRGDWHFFMPLHTVFARGRRTDEDVDPPPVEAHLPALSARFPNGAV
ncbi:DUF4240 domain-containing protein [Cryptosporangium japonicum]|uniref:DUF4240 domain-containing protein n=1 Tax=Cryptosporangium japonicum TaxID=80872 RepID=A0ABN0UHW8_9ACTN